MTFSLQGNTKIIKDQTHFAINITIALLKTATLKTTKNAFYVTKEYTIADHLVKTV